MPELENFVQNDKYPIGLTDGSIVDNQGIEPLLLVEKRMRLNNSDHKNYVLDLIIISDVASPYMEEFTASVQQKENWWRSLTLSKIQNISTGVLILSVLALVGGIVYDSILSAIISTIALTLSIIPVIAIFTSRKILKNVKILDSKKLKNLIHIKLLVFESFIKNRVMSVMKLTGSVFMKHIRRLNYKPVYENEEWKNRRIMNAIYQLREGEKRTEDKFETRILSEYLKPSSLIT
ncbi:MAG: hypothetical protein LBN74_03850 [Prevotella sp.]|nr:hypothetical protein [Prevotella sp.]